MKGENLPNQRLNIRVRESFHSLHLRDGEVSTEEKEDTVDIKEESITDFSCLGIQMKSIDIIG